MNWENIKILGLWLLICVWCVIWVAGLVKFAEMSGLIKKVNNCQIERNYIDYSMFDPETGERIK